MGSGWLKGVLGALKKAAAVHGGEPEFADEIRKRICKPRQRPQKKAVLFDYNRELTLEALSEEELQGIIHTHKTDEAVSRAVVYRGCPELRRAGERLFEQGCIHSGRDVLYGLQPADIQTLSDMILKLTEEYNEPGVGGMT